MFGLEPKLRIEEINDENEPQDMYAKLIRQHLNDVRKEAVINLTDQQIPAEENFERSHKPKAFNPGDQVISRNRSRRNDSKTGPRYEGPFKVISRKRDIYELEKMDNHRKYQRHVSSLKPYQLVAMVASLLFICLKSIIISCLDEQPPYAYIDTNYIVEASRTFVELQVDIISPCDAYDLHEYTPDLDYGIIGRPLTTEFGTKIKNGNKCEMVNVTSEGHEIGMMEGSSCFENSFLVGLLSAKRQCFRLNDALISRFENLQYALLPYGESVPKLDENHQPGKTEPKTTSTTPDPFSEEIATMPPIFPLAIDEVMEITTRRKRQVTALVTYMGLSVVTNLVSKIYHYFDPNSDENRIGRLESLTRQMVHHESLRTQVIKNLIASAKTQEEYNEYKRRELALEVNNRFVLSDIKTIVNERMAQAKAAVQDLHKARLEGHLDPVALERLTLISDFENYTTNSIELRRLNIGILNEKKTVRLNLHFELHKPDTQTKVYKLVTFNHWNLTSQPFQKLKYDGPQFVLFNKTSHCAKGMSEPATKYIINQCKTPGFIDKSLTRWKPFLKLKDPRNDTSDPFVVTTSTYSLIYCYPKKITIEQFHETCPNSMFKLPIRQSYTIDDWPPWTPDDVKIDKEVNNMKFVEEVHNYHIISTDTDEQRSKVEDQFVDFKLQTEQQLSIGKDTIWYIGLLTVVVFSSVVTIAICRCCFSYSVLSRLRWFFNQPLNLGEVGERTFERNEEALELEPLPGNPRSRRIRFRESLSDIPAVAKVITRRV